MDFMKVFDQTVRDIKREVNLKVLKVPEIEQKVLDATDNEPWGPHGTVLGEIAQSTKKFSECQMVMNVLWTRLHETGKDWRYVYKALTVLEYLVANGSERAVDDIIEHTFQISSLTSFEYTEPNGKDVGINVRKKAETIVGLLNNKEKIQEVRKKAASTRDKYVGLSSTGVKSKFSAASFGSNSSSNSSRYGGFGGSYDSDNYSNKVKDETQFEEKFDKFVPKSSRGSSIEKKDSASYVSKDQYAQSAVPRESASRSSSKGYDALTEQIASATLDGHANDDEFDPRETSKNKSTPASSKVDLFGENLIGDLMDAPSSIPSEMGSTKNSSSAVDLFTDATFLSASKAEAGGNARPEPNIDLFAAETASSVDLFAASDQAVQSEVKKADAGARDLNTFDPFAAVPLNNFTDSDPFGSFTSSTDSSSSHPVPNPNQGGNTSDTNGKPSQEEKTTSNNGSFKVKSGIWADSLNRGLIDLNITAPKKVSLTDVGILGSFSDGLAQEKHKGGHMPVYDMGRAMGTGSGLGKTGLTSSSSANSADIFTNWSYTQK